MRKSILFFAICIILVGISHSQTVTIGTQVWSKKNLDVSTFRNGDPIPEVKNEEEWSNAGRNKQPAWCYYGNDTANGTKYGKLYNWYAVNDPRGLAPNGWHVPTHNEWTRLIEYLGGQEIAGAKMKSKSSWVNVGKTTNSSGFSGLPGGYRDSNGYFASIGAEGSWWSSTTSYEGPAWSRHLTCNYEDVKRSSFDKSKGFSVRCIRN